MRVLDLKDIVIASQKYIMTSGFVGYPARNQCFKKKWRKDGRLSSISLINLT
jgi:hypothetical protein